MEDTEMFRLAVGLAKSMGLPGIADLKIQPLGDDEQGYSGARMHRMIVFFDNGQIGSFIPIPG